MKFMFLNKRFLLFCAAISFSGQALAAVCSDYLVNGVRLGRSSAGFAFATRAQLEKQHEMRAAPDPVDVATGETGSAGILFEMAKTLAEQSGLSLLLSSPVPFHIRVVGDISSSTPQSSVEAGVWTVDRKMLELATTDDELAAIVGRAMLDQMLAHSLERLQVTNGRLYRMLQQAGLIAEALTSPVLDHIDLKLQEKHDAEIRQALPVLLHRAGYSPWAIVNVEHKYSEALANDPYWTRLVVFQSQYLLSLWRNLPSYPRVSTEVVKQLKAQLQLEHDEPMRLAN